MLGMWKCGLRVPVRASAAFAARRQLARVHASLSARAYTTSGPGNSSSGGGKPSQQLPKLRYFFGIMALGTVGFLAALQYTGDRRSKGELSEQEYERIKATPKRTAFSKTDTFVVFVLGGPGSGKGTQCDLIVRDYDFAHISAGDLLRAEQDRPGSRYGDLIRNNIKNGLIVPQEVTIELLRTAMQEIKTKQNIHHFLIDGFPRQMDQAVTFEENIVPSHFTLFFECPEKIMLDRILSRGRTSGRADDNIESAKKRFKTFTDTSMPVVEYFRTANKVTTLRCDEPVDVVYKQVQEALAAHNVFPKNR